ncbi:MAG: helix-turn-helix domain-containing protein [Rhodospirillales bacterium]|nr:helix-turn-helix domain-containing protein [Rhodospirillales bacterium]
MSTTSTIGRAARAAGCKVQTIRYYEQIGLLPIPARSEGNQRLYETEDIRRLLFIRRARALGFPLPAIRDLLSLCDVPEQSCEAADAIAKAQLEGVERRIEWLQELRHELERMIEQCRGGNIADCRVIEVLSRHADRDTADHAVPGPEASSRL